MRTYIVERYVPRPSADELQADGKRVLDTIRGLNGYEQADVAYLHSIYVPEDEVSFCLFRCPSAEALTEGFVRAQVAFERVLEAEVHEP